MMDSSQHMMFWNLLLTVCLVYADVIREDGYHDYEGQFTVMHKGRMLRVLMYLRNVQQELCALRCVQHLRCKTYNYHHGKKDCELTDEEFDEMNVETIATGWYNYGTPKKVDGKWSIWRNLTECTKTCGSGTLEQWRDCDSPEPAHGGSECKGRMRRRVKCNTHGCIAVNVAAGKTVKQSSTFFDDMVLYGASNAIDGSRNTRSFTKEEKNPWWEIDLFEVKEIINIHLVISADQDLSVETRKSEADAWSMCSNLRIRTASVVKPLKIKFQCKKQSTNARFIMIRPTKNYYTRPVSINEIEVFSYENN